MTIGDRDPRARVGFGAANVLVALAVAGGVFRLLPTRWWVVDGGAVIVSALLLASGVALLRKMSVAETLTRAAAAVVLALGLALVTAIFATAGWISGVYGQVGVGGGIVFALVGALVLPYVVVLPAAELAWLGPRAPRPASLAKPASLKAATPAGDEERADDASVDVNAKPTPDAKPSESAKPSADAKPSTDGEKTAEKKARKKKGR